MTPTQELQQLLLAIHPHYFKPGVTDEYRIGPVRIVKNWLYDSDAEVNIDAGIRVIVGSHQVGTYTANAAKDKFAEIQSYWNQKAQEQADERITQAIAEIKIALGI